MKKVEVRPLEKGEFEDDIARLRTRAYYQFPEASEAEYYTAFYRWFESGPLADELHRWVALDGDRVVGHLAALPLYYKVGGVWVLAHTPGDYMVEFGYGFHAISLMRAFFRTCENFVACDMVPAVIGVQSRLGGEDAGKLHYVAKLLNVSRLPVPPVPAPVRKALNLGDWSAPTYASSEHHPGAEDIERLPEQAQQVPVRPRLPIPAPVKGIMNWGLGVADETLGKASGEKLKVEEIERFDESFDHLFERVAAVVPCVPEKDSAFLGWRYGPGSPQDPVTVLGVRGEEGLLGYAVLKVSYHGQDGNILDLMTLPGRGEVARALLRGAVRFFRREGTQIIRYRFVESPTSPSATDLLRLGFFFRSGRRYTLLVKFADGVLHETARDTANWSYSLGDGEASFWIR